MSTTAATPAPPAKGRKVLIVVAAVAVLLAVAAASAFFTRRAAPHADAEAQETKEADEPAAAHAGTRRDADATPTFVALEMLTVNLADRDGERYAQVGITLEVGDPHVADQIKQYMPAIRNNILLALGDKTADQLAARDGKEKLADEVRRETARAMGYAVGDAKSERKLPVTAVHFTNFIIQ